MPVATMVCLANSRKLGGRCVAGLVLNSQGNSTWLRPVSNYGHGELNSERICQDGSDPQLLDILKLSLLKPKPLGCHQEDVLIDPNKKWQIQGRLTYHEALKLASAPSPPLWADGEHTSYGHNDKIEASVASTLPSSLRLICPNKLKMTATAEWQNKRKVRGQF